MSGPFTLKDNLNRPAEEAYNVLRTNLKFCSVGSQFKTIAVTSCIPGEGKTTTALNLSISLAKSGMKVLFLDADLRKPQKLGFENNKGLSNLISGDAIFKDIINFTNVDKLHIISCGQIPPNPAEMINSARFRSTIADLAQMYDMVIIDTPPISSVIDGAIIASLTDATILVIKYKSVDYKLVQRAREQLAKANAKIIGVVLNKLQKREYKNYYSYYNYYNR